MAAATAAATTATTAAAAGSSLARPALRRPVAGFTSNVPRQSRLLSDNQGPGTAKRVAFYIDRILKGAKPGDLPIEQPTTLEMALNLKTAQQRGTIIPRSVLARATEVME